MHFSSHKNPQLYLCLILLISPYVCSFSDEDHTLKDNTSDGFYAGFKLGYGQFQNACSPNHLNCETGSSGFSIYTGFTFLRSLSLELTFDQLGEVSASYPSIQGVNNHKGKIQGASFNLYGKALSQGPVGLWMKVGGIYWQGSNQGPEKTLKDEGVSPLTGFDLSYDFTPQFQLRWGYQFIYRLDSTRIGGCNHHFAGMGLLYRLSHKKPYLAAQRDKSAKAVKHSGHLYSPTVYHDAYHPS